MGSSSDGALFHADIRGSSSLQLLDGHASGEYDDFLTGFVTKDGGVWGRPVGVAVGNDGSPFVTEDGSRSVLRVTWIGK